MTIVDAGPVVKGMTHEEILTGIKEVDTSTWPEFGDFFHKPQATFLTYEVNVQTPDGEVRRLLPCAFVSVVASTKEKAVEALRADLLKLLLTPWLEVNAFLAKPSTLALAKPLDYFRPEEMTVVVDPEEQRYAAFCFLFGRMAGEPLTQDLLLKLGLEHAVLEGAVGKFVG